MNIAEIIREKNKSVCRRVAERCGATPDYVRKIAYGRRRIKSKKAQSIMCELKKELNLNN